MEEIKQQIFEGERSLFKSRELRITGCVFQNGESPLKESQGIDINQSIFRWKYPLWYCRDINVENTHLLESARSGIWYTHNIDIKESIIEAPKTFRRSSNIKLVNVEIPLAEETLWNCQDIYMEKVSMRGDYIGLNSENIIVKDLKLTGNYSFDGCKNVEIHNSILISKDAFWNCENVTVTDSTIIGEYLGWNSKNVTFVNCTIESLQGLCYMDNVKMINCQFINTTQAFEYSSVNIKSDSHITSIMNPLSGTIEMGSVGELILDDDSIDHSQTLLTLNQKKVVKVNS